MNRWALALLACLIAVYPLIVLFGLKFVPVYYLGLFFILLGGLRLWFMRASAGSQVVPLILCVILILVAAYTVLSGQPEWFRYYPVAVNATLLTVFGASLWRGPPLVERMARVTDPHLSVGAVAYTRKVTILWCCFFAANGLIALYTVHWTSFAVWAWYNGALAYCLMGALFASEWLVRRRVQRKLDAQTE